MKIYRRIEDIEPDFSGACVTIGNFDGVHNGHQQLFQAIVEKSLGRGCASVAITFDPHPLQVLRPDGIKLISSFEQKVELIEKAGLDALVVIPFTREFAKVSAKEFVESVLVERLAVKELVVGYDYAFGKGRGGNIDFLREQGRIYNFPVTVVPALYINGEIASSTRIRSLVSDGQMARARVLLGRNYQIRGCVQVGKQLGGSLIGFPTANLKFNPRDLIPRHGVYVVQVIYEDKCYGGVINIGMNPTFDEDELVAETHIFDFNQVIYGKTIRVNLLHFLREEIRFDGVEALAAQIAKDVTRAKEVLLEHDFEQEMHCGDSPGA